MDISSTNGIYNYSSVFQKSNAVQHLPGNTKTDSLADALLNGSTTPTVQTAADAQAAAKDKNDKAIADFTQYMNKTTSEKYTEAWLEKHGITKEQFDKMSPQAKQKLLAQMKHDIEQQIKDAAQKSKTPLVNFTV